MAPHRAIIRTEKAVPVRRVSFWKGVLRDYLLRRRRVLRFLGNMTKRQLLRSLLSDPLQEGHPVDRDNFFCLNNAIHQHNTPYRAITFQGRQHSLKMVRYPPPLLLSFTQTHLCNTPLCNISRNSCAIPHKNKHERVLRYYRYKYRAI